MSTVIELKNVCKTQGKFQLQNLSFSLESGYVLGLIGPNGAGKSTTLRLLLSLCTPDSGEISLFGRPAGDPSLRARIGVVFDESNFYEHLTVRKNLNLMKPFYRDWDDGLCQKLLEQLDVDPGKKVKELSRGMKMKMGFVSALCHHPELLIMDEPTSGLDPLVRREMLGIVRSYMQDERHAVIFSTHITTDLERIADRIVLLSGGELIFNDDRDAVMEGHILVKGPSSLLAQGREGLTGVEEYGYGFTALTTRLYEDIWIRRGAAVEPASLEEIMVRRCGKELSL